MSATPDQPVANRTPAGATSVVKVHASLNSRLMMWWSRTTCRFMAAKAAPSAVVPEVPQGRGRRMPHAINYTHGSSHYNSGTDVFTDFAGVLANVTDKRFQAELWRFVRQEWREVLILTTAGRIAAGVGDVLARASVRRARWDVLRGPSARLRRPERGPAEARTA
ncbi:MAG: hypothetical protein U0797_10275 [Gemmataceae bacterium]